MEESAPQPRQLFGFRNDQDTQIYEFHEVRSDGTLEFRQAKDSSFSRRRLTKDEYDDMRSRGLLFRIAVARGKLIEDDLFGELLLNPEERDISLKERIERRKAKARYEKAICLQFYCRRYDDLPKPSRGDVGLRHFIESCRGAARAEKLEWVPSPSALRRALNKYGEPGHRPLIAFLTRGKQDPRERWSQEVLKAWQDAVESYWSVSAMSKIEAIAQFDVEFQNQSAKAKAEGRTIGERPKSPTLYAWLKSSECYEYWLTKYGKKAADARYNGRARGITADRPLQFVMFDHTLVDAWSGLFDGDGNRVAVFRSTLTLAIDVYTRIVLGAVLTYEPESLHAVLQCLRQVIRRKTWLLSKYGSHKGATDGWGKPDCIIVDNAWQLSGASFQSICSLAGISVRWAPIWAPTYKAIVERAIGTLNTMLWHRLDCGIPHDGPTMSKMRLTPEKYACEDLERLEEHMWNVLVTIYHVEVHDGIGMAPARRWSDTIDRWRSVVDDVRTLDRLMGEVKTCLLTAEGVNVKGHRFHDPVVTGRLLDSLLRHGKARQQRKSVHSTGSVLVRVTVDQVDCSVIQVWDEERKVIERLPNWEPQFSRQCSWQLATLIKQFAERENMAFHTDEEKYAARAAHRRSLPKQIANQPRRGRQALITAYARETNAEFMEGKVIEAVEEPSVSGMAPAIPHSLPARERDDNLTMPKGQRRGKAKPKGKSGGKTRSTRGGKAVAAVPLSSETAPALVQAPRAIAMPLRSDHLRPSPARARLVSRTPEKA